MICLETWQYVGLVLLAMYPTSKFVIWICETTEMMMDD